MQKLKIILLSYLAKTIAFLSKILKKGSGTSLPGLIVEKYFLDVLEYIGKDFEEVIFISGTNGKTTTRAILVDIYDKNGVKVCTNRGGANILRGIASSLLLNLNWLGSSKLKTVILEVEEASLPILTRYIKPDILILTNVFRDQLDAYGEIDRTLRYFKDTLVQTKSKLIINSDDKKLLSVVEDFQGLKIGFGLDLPKEKKPKFESQEEIEINFDTLYQAVNIQNDHFDINFDGEIKKVSTSLPGIYNIYNTLAALIVGYNKFGSKVTEQVEAFKPVFGRGEKIRINSNDLEIMLVKNPVGFTQVLNYIGENYKHKSINLVILINDNIADGKDVSWLWDIELEEFIRSQSIGQIFTGGSRGMDMLLRLEYAEAKVDLGNYNPDLSLLIDKLMENQNDTAVLCTYTAMLEFRQLLGNRVEISKIDAEGN